MNQYELAILVLVILIFLETIYTKMIIDKLINRINKLQMEKADLVKENFLNERRFKK